MPSRSSDAAQRLRDKAEEVRQLAESISDPSMRDQFLDIAKEYEVLARQTERLRRRD